MEIDDEGAALVAGTIHILRGPAAAGVTAADCKTITVDMLASISTVRLQNISAPLQSMSQMAHVIILAG